MLGSLSAVSCLSSVRLMANAPIRVMIVEDHQMVADGLAALLNYEPDMTVVGHVSSVEGSASKAIDLSPDVVIMDFLLSDGTGADAGRALREYCPNVKLVFLTRDNSDATQLAAVMVGASAFIHKSMAAAAVVNAVRVVAAGGSLITPQTIATLIARRRDSNRERDRLTAREYQVLRLMAQGFSSREIARRLGISYATVRSHVRSLGIKLAVHSKLQAVVKARAVALID